MRDISELIEKVVLELFKQPLAAELSRSDEQFGDYTTNIALRLSKALGQPPREVAEQIVAKLQSDLIERAEVAGPGFINVTLTDEALQQLVALEADQPLKGQVIVTEYSDPNPFKVLHAGHLYTSIVGDAISNLLENAGANVHRVNFGGDVGLHVAKTMWAILKELDGEEPTKLSAITEGERSEWMAKCYVTGTNAYEDDEAAKAEIINLNKRIYYLHDTDDQSSPFAQIYWTARQWSYDYFNAFYKRIGSGFEKYYPESVTSPLGLAKAKQLLADGVLETSDGAAVFKGEEHGLHTRVFITNQGLPTYEAKDLGLTLSKENDYHPDKSVIITGNDIVEYMKVVIKVVEQFAPDLAAHTNHITHGNVKLAGGVKMSSRKGNFLRAIDVLDAANQANKAVNDQADESVSLGAVKYSFLKNRIGGDIIYDPTESVNLHGNSGPYLQYAFARANSILNKSTMERHSKLDLESSKNKATPNWIPDQAGDDMGVILEVGERSLLRKISEYNEVVARATTELMPHHICTYLYELAQTFNRFYEGNRVIGDEREGLRIQLVQDYANNLKNGLNLLGIQAPEKM